MWNDLSKVLVFLVPFAVVAVLAGLYLLFRKTIRTRMRVEKQLADDPDINEWVVIFDWSPKVLYLPLVVVSFVTALLMFLHDDPIGWTWLNPTLIGGIWIIVFVINFLIDEYEINVKILLILLLAAVAGLLWLAYLNWLPGFGRLITRLHVAMNPAAYLIIGLTFLLAMAISYVKGLFHYVALTPNYINIQSGPTETGEQISREDYNTRVDTGDFLERIFGFGRIVITFRDARRQPIVLLVSRIGRKATKLEAVRGALAFDQHQRAMADFQSSAPPPSQPAPPQE